MKQELLDIINNIKKKYEPEGFIILGVFGSFARGDENDTSDIDILYTCTDKTYDIYPGWEFITLYEKIKNELETLLGRKIDLADREGLNEIARKYILSEVKYVA